MFINRFRIMGNRGDTIVEVILVLAVLSLAISLSYTTANRSLMGARQAQENARASQLLRSQVEQLRYLAPTPNPNVNQNIFQSTPFCMTSSVLAGATTYKVTFVSSGGCSFGTGTVYNISIQWLGASQDNFKLVATWPNVSGQGNDTVTMNYRVHKP